MHNLLLVIKKFLDMDGMWNTLSKTKWKILYQTFSLKKHIKENYVLL